MLIGHHQNIAGVVDPPFGRNEGGDLDVLIDDVGLAIVAVVLAPGDWAEGAGVVWWGVVVHAMGEGIFRDFT